MSRFSISNLMALIILLAIDLASCRLLVQSGAGHEWRMITVGLLPLLNIVLIGVWAYAPRCRFPVERRPPDDRGRILPPFVAASTLLLVTLTIANWWSSPHLWDYLESAAGVISRVFPGINRLDVSQMLTRFVIIPAILGLLVSGPPILLALAWGFVARRYRLVITPREEHN